MALTATRAAAAALTALLTCSAVGCATVQQGTAIRDPNADPGAVNTALLDPGRLPTEPRAPLGEAQDLDSGKLAEARRMADVIVMPFEVDPVFISTKPLSGPMLQGQGLSTLFYYTVPYGVTAHNFVTGFIAAAEGEASAYATKLANVVLRFASPEDAVAAAADMANRAKTENTASDNPPMIELPLPDRPETLATQSTDHSWFDIYGFTPHGPFVLAQAITSQTAEIGTKWLTTTVDKQRAALDKFSPTPVDKLTTLPVDPPGLVAKTLPSPPDAVNAIRTGLYSPHGALTYMDNPLRDQQLFKSNALEWASFGTSANVYQFREPAGARGLTDTWVKVMGEKKYSRAAPVPGLPAARCQRSPEDKYSDRRTYYCVVAVDRYVVEVVSSDEREAHQRLAAQYLMLTNS